MKHRPFNLHDTQTRPSAHNEKWRSSSTKSSPHPGNPLFWILCLIMMGSAMAQQTTVDAFNDSVPLFPNSDFEQGDLSSWTATGDAFAFQPTKGDNPTARKRHQPSGHQGEYWIGTYERFQGEPGQKPGQIQGDRKTGTLTSIPFEIQFDRIRFLIGGGTDAATTYVALRIDGQEVLKASGENHETMKPHTWDVRAFKGKQAQILICDESSAGWGHINVDDFRCPGVSASEMATSPVRKPKGPLFPNSDFEQGDLSSWTATGDAFAFQPTKGDNPAARKRHQPSGHQGEYWIGTYERFQGEPGQKPGQIQGDRKTGTLTSIPFEIQFDRIRFLIGGGTDAATTYVALRIDGQEVLKASGENHETMKPHTWDVRAFKGKQAQILICDESSAGWGHINVDDFQFQNTTK